MCKKGRPLVVMASSSTAATQTVSRGEANLLAELTNHFRLLAAVVREYSECMLPCKHLMYSYVIIIICVPFISSRNSGLPPPAPLNLVLFVSGTANPDDLVQC